MREGAHKLLGRGRLRCRTSTVRWPDGSEKELKGGHGPAYNVFEMAVFDEMAGPEFKVTVDPNERFYTAEQTIELAKQLEELGNVEVFEDPIPKSDIEGYEKIHAAANLPIAMHLGNGAGIIRDPFQIL